MTSTSPRGSLDRAGGAGIAGTPGAGMSATEDLPLGAWLPVVVELTDPVPDVPTRGAAVLRVMALWEGQPLGHISVPAVLDPYPGHLLADTLVHSVAHRMLDHRVSQLLTPPRSRSTVPATGTVVICTRNRPGSLERCLDSMGALEPRAGLDVLVVDNGDGTVRNLVERRGFRWVHEPVPGLNRARNRGLL